MGLITTVIALTLIVAWVVACVGAFVFSLGVTKGRLHMTKAADRDKDAMRTVFKKLLEQDTVSRNTYLTADHRRMIESQL